MPSATSAGDRNTFGAQFGALWRRRWLFLAVVLVAAAAAVAYSVHKTPIYESSAALRLTPQLPSGVLSEQNSSTTSVAATVDVPTAIQVIQSASVADHVARQIRSPGSVSASQVGTTNVVDITVRSSRALTAAQTANAYAREYLSIQKAQARAGVAAAVKQLQAQVVADRKTVGSIEQRIASAPSGQQTNLNAVLSSAQQAALADQSQLAQYRTALDLTSGGGVLITPATPASSPVVPKPAEYILAAILVGLIVGGGLAVLVDRLDNRVRTVQSIDDVLFEAELIGAVPTMRFRRRRPEQSLVTLRDPGSAAAEAYQLIHLALEHLRESHAVKVVQVTSPQHGDGKTTTAANLAIVAAQAGIRTMLVECDLRRATLSKVFDIDANTGLSSALLRPESPGEVSFYNKAVPNLRVIPAGSFQGRPSELLGSGQAREFIDRLRQSADLIILDSPPMLTGAAGSIVARLADASVLVLAMDRTTRPSIAAALDALRRVGGTASGVVLNRTRGQALTRTGRSEAPHPRRSGEAAPLRRVSA